MPQREEIIQQALGLPPEDRALVAAALAYSLAADSQDSLPDSADGGGRATATGEDLLGELKRRSESLRAGLTTARPAVDVLADLIRRQISKALRGNRPVFATRP